MHEIKLTFTNAEFDRAAETLGAKLGLTDEKGARRNADAADTKTYLVNVLAQDVHDHFRRKTADAAVKPAPLAVT